MKTETVTSLPDVPVVKASRFNKKNVAIVVVTIAVAATIGYVLTNKVADALDDENDDVTVTSDVPESK